MFVIKKFVILFFLFMCMFVLTSCSSGTIASSQPAKQETEPYEGKKSENIPKHDTKALDGLIAEQKAKASSEEEEPEVDDDDSGMNDLKSMLKQFSLGQCSTTDMALAVVSAVSYGDPKFVPLADSKEFQEKIEQNKSGITALANQVNAGTISDDKLLESLDDMLGLSDSVSVGVIE